MPKVFYKTRADVSPQGKAQVFICHHPDDRCLVPDIAEEILSFVDCAVVYVDDYSAEDLHDVIDLLSGVSLLVIPVTSAFLLSESNALTYELSFAKEAHIPILPLMQESGLVDLFNEVCGEVQFLDKSAVDDTAISYEEKLRVYLTSVIVGDELARLIREEFDAYIFLSYRKKDRRHARRLMEAIHESDICRDVAIWYDEFLTPGENFNDMIAEALNKSELFALAVTPNLVNEENYVKSVEYPMARRSGKPVLACELVPTDKAELTAAYEGIGDTVDAGDKEALSAALGRAFAGLSSERRSGAEHKYLIGVAYLSGVDVERNAERAVGLITSAAEDGYIPAVERLVNMYRNADGVGYDFDRAIEYQARLCELYHAEFLNTGTEVSAQDYLYALFELGKWQCEQGDHEAARGSLTLFICELEALDFGEPLWALRYRASAHSKLGEICGELEKYDAAIEHHEAAVELAERIAESGELRDLRNLAATYTSAGSLYMSLYACIHKGEDLSGYYHKKALEVTERIVSLPGGEKYRRELAIAYDHYGAELMMKRKDSVGAIEYFLKAEELIEKICDRSSVGGAIDLANMSLHIGNVFEREKEYAKAKEYYGKARKLLDGVAGKDPHPSILALMRKIHLALGRVCELTLEFSRADKYFLWLLETDPEWQAAEDAEARRELYLAAIEDAEAAKFDDTKDELEYYQRAKCIAYLLTKETSSVLDYHYLAESAYHLHFYHNLFGSEEVGRVYGRRAMELWELLAENSPHIELFSAKVRMMKMLLGEEEN